MNEITGTIVFLNCHDYVDGTNTQVRGCLAGLQHSAGKAAIYTKSEVLTGALQTMFLSKITVTASIAPATSEQLPTGKIGQAIIGDEITAQGYQGPFVLKAIWTRA